MELFLHPFYEAIEAIILKFILIQLVEKNVVEVKIRIDIQASISL